MKTFWEALLELTVLFPGTVLAYFPVWEHRKASAKALCLRMMALCLCLCLLGGVLCRGAWLRTEWALALTVPIAIFAYIRSLDLSHWISGSIALSVCAVFACLNSFSNVFDAILTADRGLTELEPWLQWQSGLFYNLLCWLFVLAAYYPATRWARDMIQNENFAQTWYVFWVIPVAFIALNLFITPKYRGTLYTGRVLKVYAVVSLALLGLLGLFYGLFLMMANNLDRNARLRQENHFLLLQQQRYESLQASIEETRQARHDLRHHLGHLSALANAGDLEAIRAYLHQAIRRIPNLELHFTENRPVDGVLGYYCGLARQEGIPFRAQIDLPEVLPADEMDVCLVLSNLLENALEASLRTAPARRQLQVDAYLHGGQLVLIQVKNTYDGEIQEQHGVFRSSKRPGPGIGIQSVRRLSERNGGTSLFTHENGTFTAKVLLRGNSQK